MIKVKLNRLSLNDVIYDTGDRYACCHELKKIVVKSLKLDDTGLYINDYYRLYHNENEDYYYGYELFFSEKKATNVVNDYIRQQNKRKERYKKEEEIKRRYENKIIYEKLEEKYVGKPIMLYRGKDGWIKTKCKEVCAWEKGIYLVPDFNGHICKLSREGKTWKMWSELEELEEENERLKSQINLLEDNRIYLNNTIDKTIEYIKAVGVLPKQIDSFVLLNILQGSDRDDK